MVKEQKRYEKKAEEVRDLEKRIDELKLDKLDEKDMQIENAKLNEQIADLDLRMSAITG